LKSDDELIAEYLSGSQRAFLRLYERYYRYVFKTILKHIGNYHDAQDLSQDIFLKLLTALKNYERKGAFKRYLNVIIRNEVISYHRRNMRAAAESMDSDEEVGRRVRQIHDPSPLPDETVIEGEMREMTFRAIDRIRNRANREALRMRLLYGLDVKEIAEIIGCSENAVRIKICRACEELKEILRK
jgi:RNA polymerase sigma-70 factor (ECF subfamily)